MRVQIILGFAILLVACTNNGHPSKSDNTKTSLDTAKVIETGIDYLFKNQRFAPTYYVYPLKIVKSKNVPSTMVFMVNGQSIEMVAKKPLEDILPDWRKPQPYLDVIKLKRTPNGIIELELFFLTIGSNFILKINEKDGKFAVVPEQEIHIQKIRRH